MKPRALLALLVVAALALLTGCGSSSSSSSSASGADPAKLAPATAPVYVDATIRPSGQLGDDAKAALQKLLNTDDPAAKLVGLADKALAKDGLSYENDIKPWLGERVGVFVSSFAGGKAVGALIADTTDTGKAKSTLDKLLAKHGKTQQQTYKGVALTVDTAKGTAAGIVEDYAVAGPLAAVKQVVDVSKGGRPITDVADFNSARSAVGADQALASAYIQPSALIDAVSALGSSNPLTGGQSAAALGFLRQVVAKSGRAVGVGLHANGDGINLQAAGLGTPAAAPAPSGADQLAALPGDAWLAVGFGDISQSLGKAFAQLKQLSALSGANGTANPLSSMLGSFRAKTGIDVQKDLLSWMGAGAIYGRGHGLTDLGLVFTVKSKDPAKSHRAVGLIANAMRKSGSPVQPVTVEGYDKAIAVRLSGSIPLPLVIAAGGDRFSVGINQQALTDVLHPASTLADSPQYGAATKALGSGLRPVFLLDTPTIVGLIEGLGAASSPSFAKVKPYLDALGPLSAGIEHDADTTKLALALALK